MTNKKLFDTIKTVNALVDSIEGLSTEDKVYQENMPLICAFLDLITIDCPRWKYHHAYDVRLSQRTGHYYIVMHS